MATEKTKAVELVVETTVPVVAGNFDIIKADLKKTLESYNLILTGETVKDGKAAAAQLNKMKQAIKLKEKAALEQIMGPVEGFRDQVKELISIVDDTRDKITEQVKAYEEKTKDEIREQLKAYRTKRLDSEGLREPFRTIEIEDLVLLGNQTKSGNLTGKVMETINGRVAENKAVQLEEDRLEAERKAAEEARIQAEVEKRAEENRQAEERKAKERADEEIQRREEEIRASEREKIQQPAPVMETPPTTYAEEYPAEFVREPHQEIPMSKVVGGLDQRSIYEDTQETRAAAQDEINRELEQHQAAPAPEYNPRTGEVTPLHAVSVYFELKVETGGATPAETAKFIREWITSQSPELGAEVQRIGVTTEDGSVAWNA